MKLKVEKSTYLLTVSIISFFFGGLLFFLSANQTSFANGWDGYYYVMQAHSWLTYGYLQSEDFSIIYPYFITASYLIGDYVMAFKVGLSILGGSLIVSAFLLADKVSGNKIVALLVPAFLIFSPAVTYLVIQFPKNVLGLFFFIFFLLFLVEKKSTPAIILLVLSFLTHRMTGALCVIVAGLYVIRSVNWKWLLLGSAGLGLLSLLPGILHISDLERLKGQFTIVPQFNVYQFAQIFEKNLDMWWTFELILMSISIVYILFQYFNKQAIRSSAFIIKMGFPVVLFICLFPFYQMESGSIGYRFMLVSPVIIFIYASYFIDFRKGVVTGIVIILMGSSFFSFKSYQPALHDPPNDLYDLVVHRLEDHFDPEDFPLVIVHKSLAEMIIYKTSFDALNWLPPSGVSTKNVLRIVSNLEYFHFTKYLDSAEIATIVKLSGNYYAMPEVTWIAFYDQVKEHQDQLVMNRILSGGNPVAKRPYYLSKGKEANE